MTHFILAFNSLLFGLGSWVAITGLWLETPVLIHHLPEGWSLASYLTFAIQLANIAPLVYWFLNRKFSRYCNEVSATNLQLFIGIVASIVLIFYWDTQATVFGAPHSVVLLACAFLLSIVDCLSSVTFLPFMARFRSVYLTPYLIGEGLSGFLPSILAIAQNVEDQYNPPDEEFNQTNHEMTNSKISNKLNQISFGPDIFLCSLLLTLIISWAAFFYLQFHQPERSKNKKSVQDESMTSSGAFFKKYILGYEDKLTKEKETADDVNQVFEEDNSLLEENSTLEERPKNLEEDCDNRSTKFNRENLEYYYLQFLILFACTITFGLLPPLQPFSCLPVSHSTLKYTVILAGLSYPVGCSIALFFKCKSIRILTLLSLLATAICAFIFYSALYSPNLPPILKTTNQFQNSSIQLNNFTNETINSNEYTRDDSSIVDRFLIHFNQNQNSYLSAFMMSQWILFNLILSYVKTMVTLILNEKNGQEALFFVGLFSQFGSLLGSAFMFVAVNYLKWFKQK